MCDKFSNINKPTKNQSYYAWYSKIYFIPLMPLESDQWEQKCQLSHPFNGIYELKCIHSSEIIVIAWKTWKQLVLLRSVMTGTHILSKQNFLLLRPSWMPSWISQTAINYTNLCWHFQILQTMPNILVYDTSCKKKRFDSLKFWLHRVPLKMTIWERKMTKILYILGISYGNLCFS